MTDFENAGEVETTAGHRIKISDVAAGNGVSSAALFAAVSLSSADILALDTTPVTVVAGVAGSAIVPLSLGIVFQPGGTPYAESGTFRLFNSATTYAASGWGRVTLISNVFNQTTAGALFDLSQDSQDYEPLTKLDGLPLRFDATGAFTNGDGTAIVSAFYYLLPLT